jgi:hypothetical protein
MEQGPYFHRDAGAPPNAPPLLVFIREEAIKNERASEAGPAVYDRAVFLRVVAPGQKNGSPIYEAFRYIAKPDGSEVEKVDQSVYKRFREVCDQWKAKAEPSQSGTPLEQWPLMDVAMVRMFKDANVYTVQQLAGLSDAGLDNVRGRGREWKAKAQAWLEQAREAGADVEARATIAKQQQQIDELKAMLQEAMSNQNKTQGFDRKAKGKRGDDMAIDLIDTAEEAARL